LVRVVRFGWLSARRQSTKPYNTELLPLFENAALLREILTWGRESSRQEQDLASEVGGGEQQRSCSPETALQLQRCEMEVEEIQCAVTRELNNIS
jgi:hypothetical protein